jgi:hypothetical protein
MSNRPDPDALRDLGESTTNVANAWAGAEDYLSRGLKAWTRQAIGGDRAVAVRTALAACELVLDAYPPDDAAPAPRQYLDDVIAAIRRWLAEPTREHQELARGALDVTRQLHAWQQSEDVAKYWILEAIDHACLAVWSGARSSYIVPLDFTTCAARAVTCVLHAMLDLGIPEAKAIDTVTAAVRDATTR